MNKPTLALAVSAALTSPAAFADVEVGPFALYGTLHSALEVISVDNVNATIAKTKDSQARLADQTSKLGFKIKHDLADGMFALAQVESRVYLGNNGDNTDNKAELGSRNTFAGIGSKRAGVLRLGRYDNAFKLALKSATPTLYGNLNDAVSDYGSKQILNRLGARQGDMIAYESPSLGGFTANVSYNLGKDATSAATDLMPQLALGMGYKVGALTLGLGYTSLTNASWDLSKSSGFAAKNNPGDQKLDAVQFGGEYKFGKYSVGAVYERTSSSLSGSTAVPATASFDRTQDVYGLTGGYQDGPLTVQLRFATANDVKGTTVTDTGARQIGVAVAYQLHKNLAAVGSLTSVKNDKNATFTSASGFALDKGNSMTQLALGLAVSF